VGWFAGRQNGRSKARLHFILYGLPAIGLGAFFTYDALPRRGSGRCQARAGEWSGLRDVGLLRRDCSGRLTYLHFSLAWP